MPRKALGVNRGRGDDELEIAPLRHESLQVPEQEIDVEAALVRLVEDDRVVLLEARVGLRLGEQDAVGHQLDRRAFAKRLVEAHLVSDNGAELAAQFLSDTRRGGARRDAPRLRM